MYNHVFVKYRHRQTSTDITLWSCDLFVLTVFDHDYLYGEYLTCKTFI